MNKEWLHMCLIGVTIGLCVGCVGSMVYDVIKAPTPLTTDQVFQQCKAYTDQQIAASRRVSGE